MISGQIPREQHRQGHRAAPRGQRPARLHRAGHQVAPARARGRRDPRRGARGGRPAPDAAGRARSSSRCRPRRWRTRARSSCSPPADGAAARRGRRATSTAPPSCCSARRAPLIYAGGGVHLSGAHDALAAVAEYLQAGVRPVRRGQGRGRATTATSRSAPRSGASPLRAVTCTRPTWCSRSAAAWPLVDLQARAAHRSRSTSDPRGDRAQPQEDARPGRRRARHARGAARAAARGRRAPRPRARPSTRRCAREIAAGNTTRSRSASILKAPARGHAPRTRSSSPA